jgi:NADH-quinone oxidoreductase subunit J
MATAVFLLLALGAVGTAVGLLVRRNPLHAALFLVAHLWCVAALFLLLQAEFLAVVQVIVYAGAIMVLFLFAIYVLVPARAEADPDRLWPARRLALPAAVLLGVVLVAVAAGTGGAARRSPPGSVARLGRLLFTDFLLPFEITSLLLLAALVGAIALARRRTT